jgi:hypothetical protein
MVNWVTPDWIEEEDLTMPDDGPRAAAVRAVGVEGEQRALEVDARVVGRARPLRDLPHRRLSRDGAPREDTAALAVVGEQVEHEDLARGVAGAGEIAFGAEGDMAIPRRRRRVRRGHHLREADGRGRVLVQCEGR